MRIGFTRPALCASSSSFGSEPDLYDLACTEECFVCKSLIGRVLERTGAIVNEAQLLAIRFYGTCIWTNILMDCVINTICQ